VNKSKVNNIGAKINNIGMEERQCPEQVNNVNKECKSGGKEMTRM
jgi:hypothetical protein